MAQEADTSAILQGNPFKVLASTTDAAVEAPADDVNTTQPTEEDTTNNNESLPPEEKQEQARDIDTMESQKEKEKLLKSSLEISLIRDKDDKSGRSRRKMDARWRTFHSRARHSPIGPTKPRP